jgi:hypothetical protein
MSNTIEYNQERTNNVCEAIKGLNAQENRFAFVDYITKDEREVINNISGSASKITRDPFVMELHEQLRDDIAYCFNMDKASFSMTNGRGFQSTNDNIWDLDIQNPDLEQILSQARMHQDSTWYKGDQKDFHISGISVSLAIVGPSTVFAEYNEDLYPDWNKFNNNAINKIVQAEENQVAIFTKGQSGAVHGWPFANYETRVMNFVMSDNEQISNFILGNTSTQDSAEL